MDRKAEPLHPPTDPRLDATRVEVARRLFSAWSSRDADAPAAILAADAVLFDVIGGEHRGWPAIRAYFAAGLERYPDLELVPTGDFWTRPDGLAMRWVMSATQVDDALGEDLVGLRWHAEGLSYLVFDGLAVVHEADFHDKGSRERSLRAQLAAS